MIVQLRTLLASSMPGILINSSSTTSPSSKRYVIGIFFYKKRLIQMQKRLCDTWLASFLFWSSFGTKANTWCGAMTTNPDFTIMLCEVTTFSRLSRLIVITVLFTHQFHLGHVSGQLFMIRQWISIGIGYEYLKSYNIFINQVLNFMPQVDAIFNVMLDTLSRHIFHQYEFWLRLHNSFGIFGLKGRHLTN